MQIHSIWKCYYEFEYTEEKDTEIQLTNKDSEEKDLSIILEKNLKFNKHITVTGKRANTFVGLIRRTFSFIPGGIQNFG